MFDNLLRRIKLLFGVGTVRKVRQDTIVVDFTEGELEKSIQFAQGYGLHVSPLPGSKAVAIFNSGDRAQGIAIKVVDRRFEPREQKPGEVGLYDHLGQFVEFTADGIKINSIKGIKFTSVEGVTFNQTITSDGNVRSNGGANTLNTHTHSDPQGGKTSAGSG